MTEQNLIDAIKSKIGALFTASVEVLDPIGTDISQTRYTFIVRNKDGLVTTDRIEVLTYKKGTQDEQAFPKDRILESDVPSSVINYLNSSFDHWYNLKYNDNEGKAWFTALTPTQEGEYLVSDYFAKLKGQSWDIRKIKYEQVTI